MAAAAPSTARTLAKMESEVARYHALSERARKELPAVLSLPLCCCCESGRLT